ncbi:M23 family metallopeptidase [Leadbetterella byssophila]|uniref:M23 family metallopeptidase n=1 Tax=Leadbetterella byssophila TaxID=316068 RepID=UPI00399FF26A
MLKNAVILLASTFLLQSDPFRFQPTFFEKYKQLLVNIRNYYVSPAEAEEEFKAIAAELREKYPLSGESVSPMVFPLVGSNYRAVGGRNGNGFYVREFDLFDQNVSGSHPAHDIFIYDRDRDCIDDRTGDYVDVVSVGHGIVVAVEHDWQEESIFKGGNYVWVYDLERGGFWYYAHNRISVVEAGQRVRPGDKLGEVGRTGFNAAKNRSDTHLHLMYLELDENLYPHPVNTYPWLKEAETIYSSTTAPTYEKPWMPDFIRLDKSKKRNTGIKPLSSMPISIMPPSK